MMYSFFCCIPEPEKLHQWTRIEHLYNVYEQAARKMVMLYGVRDSGEFIEVWVKRKKRKYELVKKYKVRIKENFQYEIQELEHEAVAPS